MLEQRLLIMLLATLVFIGLLLAFANGANDNFKGVATLYGSGTSSYRSALVWATVTTALGSVTALVLARGLLAAFAGKGLVAPEVVSNPSFPLAVAVAASLTVLLATRFGFPISTTHALIGSLVGAGLVMSSTGINTAKLGKGFVLPLLSSPVVAIFLAAALYPLLSAFRRKAGIGKETGVWIGTKELLVIPGAHDRKRALTSATLPSEQQASATTRVRYTGQVIGVSAGAMLNVAHYISAGAVSFARGLNDTPKIAALLLVGNLVSPSLAIVGVAIAIGVGGVLGARRVADTMSLRVTALNPGQGFVANIVTSALVIGASRLGMPVSTTHVSCGSLFGIGTITRQANWQTIRNILLAWLITLPIAGSIAALTASALAAWT